MTNMSSDGDFFKVGSQHIQLIPHSLLSRICEGSKMSICYVMLTAELIMSPLQILWVFRLLFAINFNNVHWMKHLLIFFFQIWGTYHIWQKWQVLSIFCHVLFQTLDWNETTVATVCKSRWPTPLSHIHVCPSTMSPLCATFCLLLSILENFAVGVARFWSREWVII